MSPQLRSTIPAVVVVLASVGFVVATAGAAKLFGPKGMEAELPLSTQPFALTVGADSTKLAEAAQQLGAVGSPIAQVLQFRCKVVDQEPEAVHSRWWLGPKGKKAGVVLSHTSVRSTLRKSANLVETGYFFGKAAPASDVLRVMDVKEEEDKAAARSLCEQVAQDSYLATFSRELRSAGSSVVLLLNGQPVTLSRRGDGNAQSKEYRAEVSEQVMAAAQALVQANPVWAHVHADGDKRYSPLFGQARAEGHIKEPSAVALFSHDDYEFHLNDKPAFRLVLATKNDGGELSRTLSVFLP